MFVYIYIYICYMYIIQNVLPLIQFYNNTLEKILIRYKIYKKVHNI